jgi:DASH complex subunit DAD1
MSHTNVLNRKLEEVYGVGREFTTVADLWGVSLLSFGG